MRSAFLIEKMHTVGMAAAAPKTGLTSGFGAVAQVWAMLQPRLGGGAAVQELDALIQDLVGRPASR